MNKTKRQIKSSDLPSNSLLSDFEITCTSIRLKIINGGFSLSIIVSFDSKQDVGIMHRLPSVNVHFALADKAGNLENRRYRSGFEGVTND